MKAATPRALTYNTRFEISIHAAREGGDPAGALLSGTLWKFQSTPPVKAATRKLGLRNGRAILFQSTPPVKAATCGLYRLSDGRKISIHAAREGGDAVVQQPDCKPSGFQSTPPVKAATRGLEGSRLLR